MNVVPTQQPSQAPTAAASLAQSAKDAKTQGVREPAKIEEKHDEHVDEPGYGHGV